MYWQRTELKITPAAYLMRHLLAPVFVQKVWSRLAFLMLSAALWPTCKPGDESGLRAQLVAERLPRCRHDAAGLHDCCTRTIRA